MFKLLRYFSITSLIFIVLATVALAAFFRSTAVDTLLDASMTNHSTITRVLGNALWIELRDDIALSASMSPDELRAHPRTVQLDRKLKLWSRNTPILKIKVYSLDGRTIYSSQAKQIGEDKSKNPGFLAARGGRTASELTRRDHFDAFEQEVADRNILSSYVPLRDPAGGEIRGVFEVYSDVTPFFSRLSTAQVEAGLRVTAVLLALYAVLFFIVRHADRVIRRQHDERLGIEQRLREAHDELESRVLERTQELERVNGALRIEIEERKLADAALHESGTRLALALEGSGRATFD